MACSIFWCGLTWEAAATLITGGLAVGGAVGVGILQTKILSSGHRLERLRAKSELFELRYRVFVEFAVFLDEAAAGSAVLANIIEATRQNVERSQFLFGREVFQSLSDLFQKGQEQVLRVDADRARELLKARQTLHTIFDPYLALDDALLK